MACEARNCCGEGLALGQQDGLQVGHLDEGLPEHGTHCNSLQEGRDLFPASSIAWGQACCAVAHTADTCRLEVCCLMQHFYCF